MNVLDTLFGPVSKKYCGLFYYLSIVAFITYIITLVGAIVYGVKQSKSASYYMTTFFMSFLYLFVYFQNRLLFSMCSR